MSKKLIIIIILFSGLLSINVYAWDDCPYGKVNDEYPGECAKYIDTDNDGICDHCQPAPEDRESGITVGDENSPANTFQDTEYEIEDSEEESEKENNNEEGQTPTTTTSENNEGKNNLLYALSLIGLPIIVIAIYSVYQRKRIK